MARNNCTVCTKRTEIHRTAALKPYLYGYVTWGCKSSLKAGNACERKRPLFIFHIVAL